MKGAFANESSDSGRSVACGDSRAAGLGARRLSAAGAGEDAWPAACEPAPVADAALRANGMEARSAPSLNSE